MSISHTPGPWVAEAADIFGDHNIVLADRSEDCRAVAAVVSNMRDPLEVEVNARLIAAAPELLTAVIQYRDDLRHPIDEDSRQRRLAMVEALISKATSRQPEGERPARQTTDREDGK